MQVLEDSDKRSFRFFPEARTRELIVQNADDELLVYDIRTNRAICLNRTAALVWQSCDGKSDLTSLTGHLEKNFRKPVKMDVVLLALKQLTDVGLIQNGESMPKVFGGLSRREVLKRIGSSSLVALPMVLALVAPRPAFAQSICTNPAGVPPGLPYDSPPTICLGTVPQCTNFCATDPFAAGQCFSCMGVVVLGGMTDCGIATGGCPCVCA